MSGLSPPRSTPTLPRANGDGPENSGLFSQVYAFSPRDGDGPFDDHVRRGTVLVLPAATSVSLGLVVWPCGGEVDGQRSQ